MLSMFGNIRRICSVLILWRGWWWSIFLLHILSFVTFGPQEIASIASRVFFIFLRRQVLRLHLSQVRQCLHARLAAQHLHRWLFCQILFALLVLVQDGASRWCIRRYDLLLFLRLPCSAGATAPEHWWRICIRRYLRLRLRVIRQLTIAVHNYPFILLDLVDLFGADGHARLCKTFIVFAHDW